MKDIKNLKVGDSVRILSVPKFDLDQREKDKKRAKSDDFEILDTASVIEKIIVQRPVVIIDEIDEYGKPWFWVNIKTENGPESHSLALMENDSWELVYDSSSDLEEPKEHKIAKIEKQIDQVMEKYEEEYLELAEVSEDLYDRRELGKEDKEKLDKEYKNLEEKYKKLDKKTGLNSLFEKLGELKKD